MANDSIFTDDELAADAVTANDDLPAAPETPAGEPQAEPAPEVADNLDDTPEGTGDPAESAPRMVPHAALHAERLKVAELRAKQAATDRRIAEIEARFAAASKPTDPVPTVEEDPVAAIGRVEADLKAMRERADAEREDGALRTYVDRDVTSFKTKTPDFDAAATYLVNSRAAELRMLDYDEATIQADIKAYERQIVVNSARTGRSAAQMIYNMAKSRGYAGAAPVKPAPDNAAAKVSAIAKGQSSERSIGGAPGGGSSAPLDIKALLAMDDDEFAKLDDRTFQRVAKGR